METLLKHTLHILMLPGKGMGLHGAATHTANFLAPAPDDALSLCDERGTG